jgi:hypothetical protein
MYYYSITDQANTNGSANTDTLLEDLRAIAGLRTQVRKLQLGVFAAPTDNNVRIRLQRTTTIVQTSGTYTAPNKNQVDAPSASTLWQTGTITLGTGVLAATAMVSLAYNMRGTAMWAAFIEDETISIIGATAPNGELVVNSQASVASVPVNVTLMFSE